MKTRPQEIPFAPGECRQAQTFPRRDGMPRARGTGRGRRHDGRRGLRISDRSTLGVGMSGAQKAVAAMSHPRYTSSRALADESAPVTFPRHAADHPRARYFLLHILRVPLSARCGCGRYASHLPVVRGWPRCRGRHSRCSSSATAVVESHPAPGGTAVTGAATGSETASATANRDVALAGIRLAASLGAGFDHRESRGLFWRHRCVLE